MANHMNKEELAQSYFHGKEGYNCAQAILKAFQDEYQVTEATIEEFKAYGGGRAQEGICGALYAAQHLAKGSQQQLAEQFGPKAGGMKCEEIKEKALSCQGYVAVAARILTQATP